MLGACHPEPALTVTAVTTALAAAAGRGAGGTGAVAAAVLAGQLSVGWSNDARDAERDRLAGRTDKPVATGALAVPVAWRAAGTALALAAGLSLLSGWRAACAHLVALALAWAYNLWLKGTALSVLPYAGAFALLPAFVTLGLPGHPAPAAWALAGGALLGSGAHLANALPDLADDLASGLRGLPQRLGPGRSRAGAAGLLGLAGLTLAFGPGRPGPLAAAGLLAGSVLAGGGLLAGARRPGSRLPFRGVLLAAAVDVALLLDRAGRLH